MRQPVEARSKSAVSTSALPGHEQRRATEIDASRISEIGPDLILTQDFCRVCGRQMVEVAGRKPLLARTGTPSRRLRGRTWPTRTQRWPYAYFSCPGSKGRRRHGGAG